MILLWLMFRLLLLLLLLIMLIMFSGDEVRCFLFGITLKESIDLFLFLYLPILSKGDTSCVLSTTCVSFNTFFRLTLQLNLNSKPCGSSTAASSSMSMLVSTSSPTLSPITSRALVFFVRSTLVLSSSASSSSRLSINGHSSSS